MTNFYYFSLTLLLVFVSQFWISAQNYDTNNLFQEHLGEHHDHDGCGFHPPKDLIHKLENNPVFKSQERWFKDNYHSRALLPVQSVPIKAHIVRTSGGTGGLTVTQLNDAIDDLNAFYINANMQFYLCDGINYIDDNTYYDFNQADEPALRTAHNVTNLINIYFCNSVTSSGGSALCGYAYFPGGPDVIMMANNCATNGSTLAHEVGHFFSLYHTHGTANGTLTDELVNGGNCTTSGDRVCDTPADPQLGFGNVSAACIYNGTAPYTGGATIDANGDTYIPDPNNIMSYARKSCRTLFSPGQYARIYAAYTTQRNYFTCPSFNVDFTATPTNSCNTPLTVNFTDASVGATSWQWDVDGDNVVDYTSQNPSHTYNTAGIYDVRLTVSNGSETIIHTKTAYVQAGATGSIPYTENFETFTPSTNATGLNNGWIATPSNTTTDFRWNPNQGATGTGTTGPDVDNTLGTAAGHYMYTEASSGAAGDVAELISPCINLNATSPLLGFAYHMFGSDIGTLHLDINSGGTWTNDIIPAITGQQQTASTDAFLTQQVNLNAYANQVVQLRFRVERGPNFRGDIAIDDINITDNPNLPEISFVNTTLTQLEDNSSGAVACRGYQDINIPLQIANAPTGDATVTFSLGGTADNYDYQLLTPTVVFPTGLMNIQNLSIRVWDDANEEIDENLNIIYTISGATNASASPTNQSFALTIQDNDLLPSQAGQSTLLSEDFEGGVLPMGWTRSQDASSTGWVIDLATNQNSGFFTIPNTNSSAVAGTNDDACNCNMSLDFLVTPAIDLSPASYVGANIQFDAYHPNDYGSSAHVLVSTVSDAGPWTNLTTLTGDVANWQNNINLDLTPYLGNANVWIAFHHDDNGAWADGFVIDNVEINAAGGDAPVATTLGATSEKYFGPNETVYFYDANGNVMARLVNNSAWDYGCTSVSIDRAGTGAVAYDNNNVQYYIAQKTLLVTPTNNSPTGQYDITLYYEGNEITTWEATSTNTRGNLNILKTGGASVNITPAAPLANGNTNHQGTSVTGATYAASDYMLTANFNTGFSGFSIGQPAPPAILNNELVSLSGKKLTAQYNQLNWQVDNNNKELNSYVLERSKDAILFETIGSIDVNNNQETYIFEDKDIATKQLCYYRLKMISKSNTHRYSNVIAIEGIDEKTQVFNVFPNPTNGLVQIQLKTLSSKNIPVMVRNSLGQIVLMQELSPNLGENQFTIDLKDLAAGVYSIQIRRDGILSTKTIIRE